MSILETANTSCTRAVCHSS